MATSPTEIAAPPSRPTQYSLRSILLLTAAVAAVCALGSWLGAGWLPLLLGMTLYLANYLGILGFLQGRRVAQTALYLASAAWTVSLFLPLHKDIPGWQMAWDCLTDWSLKWPEKRTHGITSHVWGRLLLPITWVTGNGAVNLANVGMALCPFFAHRLVMGKVRWLRTILIVSTPIAWICCLAFGVVYLVSLSLAHIAPAYFVWCGALTITAIVLRISGWQLFAATAMSLWLALGAWAWIGWLRSLP